MFETVYVSTQLRLSTSEALAAMDVWHGRLGDKIRGARSRRARHRVWVRAQFANVGSDYQLLRRLRGTIWVLGRPVPVELELLIWSPDVTELGLRPMSLRWPVQTPRYVDQATGVVRDLAAHFLLASRGGATQSPVNPTSDDAVVVPHVIGELQSVGVMSSIPG